MTMRSEIVHVGGVQTEGKGKVKGSPTYEWITTFYYGLFSQKFSFFVPRSFLFPSIACALRCKELKRRNVSEDG